MRKRDRSFDEPMIEQMVRTVTLIKEKVSSCIEIDPLEIEVALYDHPERAALRIMASFDALKNPVPPPMPYLVYRHETWWDRVKSERLGWFVYRGILSEPRKVPVEQVINQVVRLCPHRNGSDSRPHVQFAMLNQQSWDEPLTDVFP